MDSLTKENFWNDLMKYAPNSVNHFCQWIDEYKKRIGWIEYFGEKTKFHDVPIEMQIGIIIQFFEESTNLKGKHLIGNDFRGHSIKQFCYLEGNFIPEIKEYMDMPTFIGWSDEGEYYTIRMMSLRGTGYGTYITHDSMEVKSSQYEFMIKKTPSTVRTAM